MISPSKLSLFLLLTFCQYSLAESVDNTLSTENSNAVNDEVTATQKTVSNSKQVSDSEASSGTKKEFQLEAQKKALENFLEEAEKEQYAEKIEQQQTLIDKAVKDFVVLDEEGNEVVCSQEDTIALTVDGNVRYRCRSQEQALGEEQDSNRGEAETNSMIDDLMQTSSQSSEKTLKLNKEELEKLNAATRDSQLSTEGADGAAGAAEVIYVEDNDKSDETHKDKKETSIDSEQMSEQDNLLIINTDEDSGDIETIDVKKSTDAIPPASDKPTAIKIEQIKEQGFFKGSVDLLQKIPVKAYLSLRFKTAGSFDNDWGAFDGGSRFGLIYADRLANEDQFIIHYEAGSNVFNRINNVLNSQLEREVSKQKNDITRRLSYIRYGRDDYYVVLGKNWSVYHFIAQITDRFNSVGGKASGIYNASTDGGASGSGRAENALQLRSSRGNVQWGLQVQAGNEIPRLAEKVDYQLNAALAGKWKSLDGYSFGFAVNRAVPEKYTAEMLGLGLSNSSDSFVAGVDVNISDWLLASTISLSKNHVTDDRGHYYDAKGWEFYARYRFSPRFKGRTGFNWQQSDDADYQAEHEIQEYYLSYEYSYNKLNLQDRVYLEYVFNRGTNADGSKPSNSIILGMHFNLSN